MEIVDIKSICLDERKKELEALNNQLDQLKVEMKRASFYEELYTKLKNRDDHFADLLAEWECKVDELDENIELLENKRRYVQIEIDHIAIM